MQIVKVRYYMEALNQYSNREYSYYSEDTLAVGDLVNVPTRDTIVRAQVSAVDVPEAEVAAFKDKLKVIPAGTKKVNENIVGVPNRSVPNETEAVIRVDPGACLAPTLKTGREIAEKMAVIDDPVISEAMRDMDPESTEDASEAVIADIAREIDSRPTTTAVINIAPSADAIVRGLVDKGNAILRYAQARVITANEHLTPATEDLSFIAVLTKALKEKREEYVRPIKGNLDAVNAAFKTFMAPLEEADRLTRLKILAFRQEQEHRRQEAEEINRLRMEAAQKEMVLTGELSEPVNLVEVSASPPAHVRTEVGTLGTAKVWRYEVVNFAAVPDEYKILDGVKAGRVLRAGISIPGIRAWQEETLRVTK